MGEWKVGHLNEADETRPDPNEPYRYTCTECGNHRVVKRHPEVQLRELDNTRKRKGVAGGYYYCRNCGARLYDVYDEKNDERTRM